MLDRSFMLNRVFPFTSPSLPHQFIHPLLPKFNLNFENLVIDQSFTTFLPVFRYFAYFTTPNAFFTFLPAKITIES
tara:strand:- start:1286 stop:1513 length:228 start_codon:yes stop_codon:yes gene_type:complete